VSTESSRTSADPKHPDFGANEWLVDELYQKYLEDPSSVDQAWWNFFADYQPDSRPVAKTTTAAPSPANNGAATAAAPQTAAPTVPPQQGRTGQGLRHQRP
jgi:2-oxoglutarate dehydrogenase complex, dehydrogenase (E1) component, and related enzymes